jgi:undecaprenyl-diphosphatase
LVWIPETHDVTRLAWLLLVGGLLGFVVLALAYDRAPLATVDRETAEWVGRELPHVVEWLARPFSWLGGWIGMTILGVCMGVVLLRERNWPDLVFLVVALLGSQLAVSYLKAAFERPRPDVGSAVPLPDSAGFPSGHASEAVAGIGALAILVSDRFPNDRRRAWFWAIVAVLSLCVGLSRIALNVHYVTDVLAGWCFGLAWLGACLLVRERLRSSR